MTWLAAVRGYLHQYGLLASPGAEHQLRRAQVQRRAGAGVLLGLAIFSLVAGSAASGAAAAPERILASTGDRPDPELPAGGQAEWLGHPSSPVPANRTLPEAEATPVPASEVTDLGIPTVALDAYRSAMATMDAADPGCRIDWSLIAGIGRVESDHGQYGGRHPAADGTVAPPILGIALDGRPGVALIRDTDGGRLDFDTTYDRAVGPMQFIPGTWSAFSDSDGDGNGVADPHNLYDAALAAANYLCSGPGDLSMESGQRSAVFRYNHSESYVDLVLSYAQAYAAGVKPSGPPPQPAGQLPTVPEDPITDPAHPGDPLPGDSSGEPTTSE
ncbi:MAG: hypothetical protein M3R66_08305, partial [Actinomycetota bacterium]|nr:hypothetical protein [Actinomycetota bacterium]